MTIAVTALRPVMCFLCLFVATTLCSFASLREIIRAMGNGYSHIKNLIFDWDGTLVDSAHLGLVAFEKTFSELGVPFVHDVYEATYSPNWYRTYEALGMPKEH